MLIRPRPFALAASPAGEDLIGARAYRVIFAFASLPLAIAAVMFFINHRYDGVPLWNIRCVCGWAHRLPTNAAAAAGCLHKQARAAAAAVNAS